MATIHYHTDHGFGIADRIRAFFDGIKEKLHLHAVYKHTVAELDALSERELDDLGLARADIRTVARECVYGA